MVSVYWLIAFVVLVGVEAATTALTTIWFAGGAVFGFLFSLFGFPVEAQLGVFLAASFILLLLTRPLAMRYVNRSTVKTNVDSLIGRTVRVTQEINNGMGTGLAVVGGQEWMARSYHEEQILVPDTMAVIREIRGVTLIVEQLSEKIENSGI